MLTYGTGRKFWVSIALCFCKKDNLLKTFFFITFATELEWWCPVMPSGCRG